MASDAAADAAAAPPPSDEEMRKLLKPDPPNEQVLHALRTSYATGEESLTIVRELESYDDRNFLVEMGNHPGTRYLLKVHNGVESREYVTADEERSRCVEGSATSVIDLQNFIFEHLSSTPEYKVTTSKSVPVRNHRVSDGETSAPAPVSVHSLPVVSQSHAPADLVVRLLSWVEGRPMSSVPSLPVEALSDAGAYLGRLRRALDDLGESKPEALRAATRYHAWDGQHTSDLHKFVRYIENEGRRGLVQRVIDAFGETFAGDDGGAAKDFPRGILMGDFNDANILVDDDLRISGVIDFGDSTHSWRVLDISVAMAYAMISSYGKTGRSLSAAAALLRGVHSVYPLTASERRHLRLLVACRLACSVTLGAYSHNQNPENEYLLLHSEPAWKALELLWGQEGGSDTEMARAIDRLFERACDAVESASGENGGSGTPVNCSDISLPDPHISDVLSSVRGMETSSSSSPPAKKRKTDDSRRPAITFVTGNKKKLEEVVRILDAATNGESESSSSRHLPFEITNLKIDLPELQGDPNDIAREKCALAAREIDGPVITEDTSLCFAALGDLPGPYIKWFLEKCGHDGLNDMIKFSSDKSAYALTVVAFCPGPGKVVQVFDGRTRGKIVPPRGSLEFGWDPVFEPEEGGGLSYAEMTKEGKDAISHRSRAFSKLRDYFLKEKEAIQNNIR